MKHSKPCAVTNSAVENLPNCLLDQMQHCIILEKNHKK